MQPHVLLAGTRVLLETLLPDVLAALRAAGVRDAPIESQMPLTLEDRSPAPGDEELRPLMTRRATVDWMLGRVAAAEPGVTVRHGVIVARNAAGGGDVQAVKARADVEPLQVMPVGRRV